MSKAGRPRNFPPCPDCKQPIKSSHSPYYKCGCRGYIVRDGKLCQARTRVAGKEPKEVNLSPIHLKIALHIRAGVNASRELQRAIGNGSMLTQEYLKDLRQANLVTWDPTQKRTLQLTERGRAYLANYILLPCGTVGEIEVKETRIDKLEAARLAAIEFEALQEAV